MPIQVISAEESRRRLALQFDPDRAAGAGGETESAEVKDAAIRLASILAKLHDDVKLDAMSKWERIRSGIEAACAKVDDADLDRFVHLCLAHVLADGAQTAACEPLAMLLETFAVRPPEWRRAFVRYCQTRTLALIVHGRRRWEGVKNGSVEL